jgi:hypothetical protein
VHPFFQFFFFFFFGWFNYLPCTLFSRKKKEKVAPFSSKLQFFCQIVIFFHKLMKNKNVVLKQVVLEKMWACNFSWGRRLKQVFEADFFDQVGQGRTEGTWGVQT